MSVTDQHTARCLDRRVVRPVPPCECDLETHNKRTQLQVCTALTAANEAVLVKVIRVIQWFILIADPEIAPAVAAKRADVEARPITFRRRRWRDLFHFFSARQRFGAGD